MEISFRFLAVSPDPFNGFKIRVCLLIMKMYLFQILFYKLRFAKLTKIVVRL